MLLKQLVKKIISKWGIQIKMPDRRFASLKPEKQCRGNVLLSYIINPFLLREGESISNAHHNEWLSYAIATTFLSLGYCVDVIHYTNQSFSPKKKYSFFVAARTNFQKIAQLLNKDCVKIVHLDTAHWLFNNTASYKRCLALQQRKNVSIKSFKWVEPNWAIEYADYATTNQGNGFNVSTYRYAKKPIFQIPLPAVTTHPWPEDKDFDTYRNQFLWFGSRGLVHKGLDLVLDAFAEMPEYQLTVCGPIRPRDQQTVKGPLQEERDFEKAYYRELYQKPNINTVGWVDVKSPEFIEITNKCIGIIFPSCSEGGGASVITCMQAGLIPIVSYESNVEVKDFGLTLNDCTIEEIRRAIKTVSSFPANDLEQMALKTWEYSREYHTRERFAENYQKIIQGIIDGHLESIVSEGVLLSFPEP